MATGENRRQERKGDTKTPGPDGEESGSSGSGAPTSGASRTEEGKAPQWRSEVSPVELCLRQEAHALLILFIALVKHPDQKQLGETGVYLASFPGHKPSLRKSQSWRQTRTMEAPACWDAARLLTALGRYHLQDCVLLHQLIIKTASHRRPCRSL